MTEVTIYKDANGEIAGFELHGHADFNLTGEDVLCAAVSTLVSHTIGAINEFTSDACENTVDEATPKVLFKLTDDSPSAESRMMLNAFESSIADLADAHPENITMIIREV